MAIGECAASVRSGRGNITRQRKPGVGAVLIFALLCFVLLGHHDAIRGKSEREAQRKEPASHTYS